MTASTLTATAQVIDENAGIVQISNVRIGFKTLWGPNIVKGVDTKRNVAQFWLDKETEKAAFDTVYGLAAKVFGKKPPFNNGETRNESGSTKWNGERFGIHHDTKKGCEYFCIKTTQPATYKINYIDSKGRLVRDFDPKEIENKIIYAGCRVNVRLRYSTSEMDKKLVLWPNLVAIQFAGHDTPLGGESEETITSSFGEVNTGLDEENTGFGVVEESKGNVDIDSLM